MVEFDFSPEDILSGKVKYDLIDFRNNLYKNTKTKLSDKIPKEQLEAFEGIFWFIFIIAKEIDISTGVESLLSIMDEDESEIMSEFADDYRQETGILQAILTRKIWEFNNDSSEELDDEVLSQLMGKWAETTIESHRAELRREIGKKG